MEVADVSTEGVSIFDGSWSKTYKYLLSSFRYGLSCRAPSPGAAEPRREVLESGASGAGLPVPADVTAGSAGLALRFLLALEAAWAAPLVDIVLEDKVGGEASQGLS